ncbi:MAG: thioredoxin-like domain-containing protein [Gemmatales bacterium]|nr:thioredoxin-like domain-containing protein [Gemmatales bacterium]MCS7160722.1 thioredoxin-like domain-containing protein [Gemmatales bacterium]MDW8175923.1 thioredoxin-like domain-containing protein [Gemmatales bacterium]MDW8222816.1 thioredoxin-like domain-containing protein [Gemmatales bacterium]
MMQGKLLSKQGKLILGCCGLWAGFLLVLPMWEVRGQAGPKPVPGQKPRVAAPELEGGVEWLNTSGPIRLRDLRGKIVLLDFWTYCCINCIHVLPDLARLEKKYPQQLVVIGVHSPKFDTEKDSKNIREAILRYGIEHPVVNDAHRRIWNSYRVIAWPTFFLIDPEGYIVGRASGEGLGEVLDAAIAQLIEEHRARKTLNEQPIRFDLEKFRQREKTPLYFPGKVLADATSRRLFIADSSHHRLVVTDWEGKVLAVAGTGEPGWRDGPFDKAQFNDPQGLALDGEKLYVADRKNHLIRILDLRTRQVATLAGTGQQSQDRRAAGKPREIGLNSPWDLLLVGSTLYIAMAGHHQIWKLDLQQEHLSAYAGSGLEEIIDGTLSFSAFAQPSGLATDGQWLYVADSETSSIRAVSLDPQRNEVRTLVGMGLFEFGDRDGQGRAVRLQHPLGIAYHNGQLYIADTYNNKIKVLDPAKRTCQTFLGDRQAGHSDEPPRFDEPAGICVAGNFLFVADTNNHAIRVIHLQTKRVRTLALQGLTPPAPPSPPSRPSFPEPAVVRATPQQIPTTGELTVQGSLPVLAGQKLVADSPWPCLVEALRGNHSLWEQTYRLSADVASPQFRFTIPADKLASADSLRITVGYSTCPERSTGVCLLHAVRWEIPIQPKPDSPQRALTLEPPKDSGKKP